MLFFPLINEFSLAIRSTMSAFVERVGDRVAVHSVNDSLLSSHSSASVLAIRNNFGKTIVEFMFLAIAFLRTKSTTYQTYNISILLCERRSNSGKKINIFHGKKASRLLCFKRIDNRINRRRHQF